MLKSDQAGIYGGAANPVFVSFDAKLLNPSCHLEQLEHSGTPAASGEAALRAAGAATKPLGFGPRNSKAVHINDVWRVRLCTRGAVQPHEALRHNAKNHTGSDASLDAKFREAADGCNGVIGMQRREDQMSGHGCMNCGLRRLRIPNFADQDHIRILSKNGTEGTREGHAGAVVCLDLRDPVDFVFNGVLDRDNVHRLIAKLVDETVERGRLTASRRSDNEENALRASRPCAKFGFEGLRESDIVKRHRGLRALEQTNDN